MKKLLFAIGLILLVFNIADAQNLQVHNSGNTMYANPVSSIDSIKFDGTYSKFNITGSTSPLNLQKTLVDSITFTNNNVALDKIYIIYNGTDKATIINPYASQGLTITASGGTVTATGATGISNLEYNLLGTSSAGSLTLSSTTPASFVMNNLQITNAAGPAIIITGSQTHTFISQAGTSNSLSDGSGSSKNGALQTDGKIIIAGTGSLAVTGVKKHGIVTTSSIEVQSSSVTINSAASDGLHSEGFTMSGGTVTVAASAGDGIDAGDGAIAVSGGTINVTSTAVDVKALKTGNGTITVSGGVLKLNVAGNTSKAVSAKGVITINDGTFTINLSGAAVLTASGSGYDPSYCTGIKSDAQVNVNGGNFTIQTSSAAAGAKGFSSDGNIAITNGIFNITTTGGGANYTNVSGVADSYSTTAFSTDGNIIISGGTFTLVNSGEQGKQFSSDGAINVTGGTINITNSGAAGKGFKADGNIFFDGSNTTVNLSGATVLTASGSGYDPSYPTGIKATGTITVNSGTVISVTGTAAATGAKGLSADNGIIINNGSVTTSMAGGGANYTTTAGVADSYAAAGLSSDADITIAGGTITLTNSGNDGKNVNADANIIVSGGSINLTNNGASGKGYNADANITFNGGNSTINLSGATVLTASGSGYDPSYPTGVKADGSITVNSGTINVTATAAATGARGLSADKDINVLGGEVVVSTAGNGTTYTNAAGTRDSYAAAAFSADSSIAVTGGTITTTSSGTGGKGLKSDGKITIGSVSGSPVLNITTTGTRFLVSGTDYSHPKTMVSAGPINIINGTTTLNSTDDGIHSDVSITISGGNNKISAISSTQGVGEGIEAPIINFTGGVTDVTASNDGINATYGTISGGTESDDNSQLNISGGILIVAGSDAIDSNGDITITGGTTIVSGPTSSPEEGLDFNGTFLMNGGLLISAGSNSNMTKAMSASSTQVGLFLKSSTQLAATSILHIENASGTEMVTFKPKNAASYFHFSSSALAQNAQYKVYFGGNYTGGSYTGNSTGWGLYTGGTYSSTGATLKSTFTTLSSSKVNTVPF